MISTTSWLQYTRRERDGMGRGQSQKSFIALILPLKTDVIGTGIGIYKISRSVPTAYT